MNDPTRCLEYHIGEWFSGVGRERVEDRKHLRQMNMAVALAYSRWLELDEADAIPAMRRWLDEVEARAVTRRASARAEAIRQVRRWLDSCVGDTLSDP